MNNSLILNQIYHLDCFELFQQMKQANILVDAIITDPPYNISKKDNFFTSIGRTGRNHGSWDYHFDQTSWIKEAIPLLKRGGSIVIFNDWKNLGLIAKELEKRGCQIKDLIRWKKTNPMPRNINRRYVTDFEFAIWAVKGDSWTFNKSQEIPYLRPEYTSNLVLGKERIHPTQKSLLVIKEIMLTHTNLGDLVLDPFMGSGTTALACQALGRNYLGCEINQEYFTKSLIRLTNHQQEKIC